VHDSCDGGIVRTAWGGFDLAAPFLLATAERELRAVRERLESASSTLKAARNAAVDAPRLFDAEPRADQLMERIQSFEVAHGQMIEARDRYIGELRRLELKNDDHEKHLLETVTGGEERWQQEIAEAGRLDERRIHLTEVGAEISRLEHSRGKEPSDAAAKEAASQARVALADFEEGEGKLRTRVTEVTRTIATLEERISSAEEAAEKRKGYQTDIEHKHQEQADWRILEKGSPSRREDPDPLGDSGGPQVRELRAPPGASLHRALDLGTRLGHLWW
jgi:chromosome segregation ATPase